MKKRTSILLCVTLLIAVPCCTIIHNYRGYLQGPWTSYFIDYGALYGWLHQDDTVTNSGNSNSEADPNIVANNSEADMTEVNSATDAEGSNSEADISAKSRSVDIKEYQPEPPTETTSDALDEKKTRKYVVEGRGFAEFYANGYSKLSPENPVQYYMTEDNTVYEIIGGPDIHGNTPLEEQGYRAIGKAYPIAEDF